jgi:hypothetical protein
MEIGPIFLVLALLLLVALFVGRPLLEKDVTDGSVEQNQRLRDADHKRSALLAERDRILNALQELDFDYTLGKIPAEDYPAQRAVLVKHGAETLRSLDALSAEVTTPMIDYESEAQRSDQLVQIPSAAAEGQLKAERKVVTASTPQHAEAVAIPTVSTNGRKLPPPGVSAPDDDLEILLANRRRARQEKAVGFCHHCGGPLQKSDRFCPKCGARQS